MKQIESYQSVNNIKQCPKCGMIQPMYKYENDKDKEHHWMGCRYSIIPKEVDNHDLSTL